MTYQELTDIKRITLFLFLLFSIIAIIFIVGFILLTIMVGNIPLFLWNTLLTILKNIFGIEIVT